MEINFISRFLNRLGLFQYTDCVQETYIDDEWNKTKAISLTDRGGP
jgi:hypothetical protein